MTANEYPTADPMPEPTPDRAVVDELREAIDNLEDASYRYAKTGEDDWGNLMVKWRVTVNDLLARLAATERPADGVMIPLNVARGIVEWPPMFNEWERLARLQDAVFAAIRAASDGGDCG